MAVQSLFWSKFFQTNTVHNNFLYYHKTFFSFLISRTVVNANKILLRAIRNNCSHPNKLVGMGKLSKINKPSAYFYSGIKSNNAKDFAGAKKNTS